MQRSIYSKGNQKTRRLAAAAAAVARARAQILSSRRMPLAPPRTGGFWGTRRVGLKELKVIDTGTATQPIDGTGDVVLLNGIATGTDFTDRIGRKVILRSIFGKFTILPGSSSVVTGDSVRVLIVYDSQTNGAAPAVTDILRTANFMEPLNLNNRDRFKILFDKHVTMNATVYTAGAPTVGNPNPKFFKFFKKLNHEMIFQGTAATSASIATGGIYLVPISLQDDLNTIYYNVRIRFEDA